MGGSLDEPPMPSTPPPPLPASIAPPPPLPARTSLVGASTKRPLPARPSRGHGSSGSSAGQRPAAAKGNIWLAKAGLTRKNVAGSSSPAPAPPATPPREGGSWRQGGGTPTPPPKHMAGGRAGGGIAAARTKGASGAWAKLHRRCGCSDRSALRSNVWHAVSFGRAAVLLTLVGRLSCDPLLSIRGYSLSFTLSTSECPVPDSIGAGSRKPAAVYAYNGPNRSTVQ